jgi:hypothetical protein
MGDYQQENKTRVNQVGQEIKQVYYAYTSYSRRHYLNDAAPYVRNTYVTLTWVTAQESDDM